MCPMSGCRLIAGGLEGGIYFVVVAQRPTADEAIQTGTSRRIADAVKIASACFVILAMTAGDYGLRGS